MKGGAGVKDGQTSAQPAKPVKSTFGTVKRLTDNDSRKNSPRTQSSQPRYTAATKPPR